MALVHFIIQPGQHFHRSKYKNISCQESTAKSFINTTEGSQAGGPSNSNNWSTSVRPGNSIAQHIITAVNIRGKSLWFPLQPALERKLKSSALFSAWHMPPLRFSGEEQILTSPVRGPSSKTYLVFWNITSLQYSFFHYWKQFSVDRSKEIYLAGSSSAVKSQISLWKTEFWWTTFPPSNFSARFSWQHHCDGGGDWRELIHLHRQMEQLKKITAASNPPARGTNTLAGTSQWMGHHCSQPDSQSQWLSLATHRCDSGSPPSLPFPVNHSLITLVVLFA